MHLLLLDALNYLRLHLLPFLYLVARSFLNELVKQLLNQLVARGKKWLRSTQKKHRSRRRVTGNVVGNYHLGGGARPKSAPISTKNALTCCQSPDRATSNSLPCASLANTIPH